MIEYFDFTVYAFLLVYFAPLFFPSTSETASTLSAVAALGIAYLVRPLGSALWGWIGDRKGRRSVLTATVALMGVATLGMGLLPTYGSIGFAAPVLLVLLRVCQGLSAAGENMSASSYIIESSSQRRRALYGSIVPTFAIGGYALGALTAGLMAFILTAEEMAAFGWRIPFLICAPLTLVVLYMRRRLEDSPEFQAISQADEVSRSPLAETVRSHWKALLKVIALTIALAAPSFIATVFVVGHLIQSRKIPGATVYLVIGIALLCSSLLSLPAGLLADRFGRRPVVIGTTLGLIVTALPILLIVRNSLSIAVITIALIVLLGLYAFINCVSYTLIAEWFPTRVRLSGSAVGFNIGTAIAGGLAPYVTLQVVWTGSDLAPAIWIMATSTVALVVVWFTHETRNAPLER
jgi:MFS transporter, MHS family, proline/betaine transporter